ncbi:MAG: hypothetical protein RIS45_1655 [Planctomycetota bacterium]|jgi:DNA-directed RNA polymerase specialized sigma24 family protein
MTGNSGSSSRAEAIAALLADIAPVLRARIRARRGARIAHIGTSDIYATVVRRTVELEKREGLSALEPTLMPAGRDDRPRDERRGVWKLLHMLVDRVILDAKRRERAEQRALRDRVSAASASGAVDPQESALNAEERVRIAAMVESLGESDRELLYLRLSGLRWAEIAARTGSSEAACRQRFHRLTAEFARILGVE